MRARKKRSSRVEAPSEPSWSCRLVGIRMKQLREQLGMTATALALEIGLSQAQVSRLEGGKQGFRSDTLLRIADALGVKPIELFVSQDTAGRKTAPDPDLSEKLREALNSPEFVWVAETVAEAFVDRKDAFETIRQTVNLLVGKA